MKKIDVLIPTKVKYADDFKEKVTCFRKNKRLMFDWPASDFENLGVDTYLKPQSGYFLTQEQYEEITNRHKNLETQVIQLLEITKTTNVLDAIEAYKILLTKI